MLSCEFCEIPENICFTEQLWATASDMMRIIDRRRSGKFTVSSEETYASWDDILFSILAKKII